MGYRQALGAAPPSRPERTRHGGLQKGGFAAELAKVKATLPKRTPIEIWFQDEARIGQKNKITRRWAKRGTRPSAPQDQRTKSAYIFGAICPEQGKGAGLVLPFCNTETMSLHLAEISLAVAPGAHAVLLMDQAGWHSSGKLDVPDNISIIALPAKCPELNPVENIWQFMRDNWLSNRVFTSYDDIVDHCCEAWNKLIDQPWRIMSIGRAIGPIGHDHRDLVLPQRLQASRRRAGGPASVALARCRSTKNPPAGREEIGWEEIKLAVDGG